MANLLEKSEIQTAITPQVFLFGSTDDANRWLLYNSFQSDFIFLDAKIGDHGRILIVCQCAVELDSAETVEN